MLKPRIEDDMTHRMTEPDGAERPDAPHVGVKDEGETDAARTAARAWIEGYGIRTAAYTRHGGDHPMMDTLPQAFLDFAARRAALRSDQGGR